MMWAGVLVVQMCLTPCFVGLCCPMDASLHVDGIALHEATKCTLGIKSVFSLHMK